MKLTKPYIDSLAPNQNAIQNAQSLVAKNNFVKLAKTPDESLLFGECLGSGAENYRVSADFIKPESPVFRCTCPSRQFPCKHSLGLMYSLVEGKKFQVGDTPPEIIGLREKAEKKAATQEKRKNAPEPAVKKINKAALEKKIKAQIEGIDLLDKLIQHLVRSGFGALDVKTVQIFGEQAKQLGDYYLPGAQDLLLDLLGEFKSDEAVEVKYRRSLPRLLQIYALIRKGREYLTRKATDPMNVIEVETSLEELLGHAWQLSELRDLGRLEQNVELVQLGFTSMVMEARREFVDIGIWLNLGSGMIQETRNYRPFKAAAHLREDDSCFQVMSVKELFIYPGDLNPRIRWEEALPREISDRDFEKVQSWAIPSFGEVIKAVKNQLKNPLVGKNPIQLLQYTKLGTVNGLPVIENHKNERLVLRDIPGSSEPSGILALTLLEQDALKGGAILVRFHQDFQSRTLQAQPLSIITEKGIRRLLY